MQKHTVIAAAAVIVASIWFAASHASVTLNGEETDLVGVSFSETSDMAEISRTSDEISAQKR